MSEARDAKIVYGDSSVSNGLVLSSSPNTLKGIINGADLTITGVSDTPVTITAASSATDILVSLRSFIENYNTFREQLNVDMYYEVSPTEGIQANSILWNNPIARAFDRDVTNMLQKTVTGIPGIHSLAALGITMSSNAYDATTGTYDPTVTKVTGKLYFDEDKFMEVWGRDPEGVQKFFFNEHETVDKSGNKVTVNTGWAQQFTDMADSLIGSNDGALIGKVQARLDVLDQSIYRNEQRLEYMEERLDFKRQMYLKQFYAMEQALAKMSTQSASIANIASAWTSNYSSGNG
jgi:flagellar hook-associated protein 2